MPSAALQVWNTTRLVRLDEIESAHRAIGGAGRGRRYATRQLNHAYTVLLSSEFQGFCRDLHSESVDALISVITPTILQPVLRSEYLFARKLDFGNPTPRNIAADFNRLGIRFQTEVDNHNRRNIRRRQVMEDMNRWRNAIAHQDFNPTLLGGHTSLRLSQVRGWRRACNALVLSYDTVMYNYLTVVMGTTPW
jgi:hypothetical protein